jgi:hypothetical protein
MLLPRPSRKEKLRPLLVFVGASIVLSTYVIREGWREDLKDLIDSIGYAQSVFEIRDDSHNRTLQFTGMEQKIDILEQRIVYKTQDPFNLGAIQGMLMTFREIQDDIAISLDNTSRLLDSLPSRGDDKRSLQTLEDRLKEGRASLYNLGVVTARASAKVGPDLLPDDDTRRQIYQATTEVQSINNDLWTRNHALTSEVLQRAKDLHQKKETEFRYATWVSYALYSIGWILGLVGNLYNVEGSKPED